MTFLAGWSYRQSHIITESIAPTGNVTVTNNSNAVLGNGTNFLSWSIGDKFKSADGVLYDIDAIADNTHLTLHVVYGGSTLSGQAYVMNRTNYQIPITIHSGAGSSSGNDVYLKGHCAHFPMDIDFTDPNNNQLYFWIRDPAADPCHVWVKVGDIASSNDSSIYIYYGKSSQSTSLADFDNAFIFGDPMDNTTLNTSRWPSVDGNPTYSIDATTHILTVTDMSVNSGYGKGFHSKSFVMPSYWIIEDAYDGANGFLLKATATSSEQNYGMMSLAHTTWGTADYGIAQVNVADWWNSATKIEVAAAVGGAPYDYYRDDSVSSESTYWKMKKISDGKIYIHESGTQREAVANTEVPTIFHMGIMRCASGFASEAFGAFKIRKYIDTEPANSTWGAEELAGTAYQKTCSEILGLKDGLGPRTVKAYRSEILGLKDTFGTRRGFVKVVSEILGMVDSFSSGHTPGLGLLVQQAGQWARRVLPPFPRNLFLAIRDYLKAKTEGYDTLANTRKEDQIIHVSRKRRIQIVGLSRDKQEGKDDS